MTNLENFEITTEMNSQITVKEIIQFIGLEDFP